MDKFSQPCTESLVCRKKFTEYTAPFQIRRQRVKARVFIYYIVFAQSMGRKRSQKHQKKREAGGGAEILEWDLIWPLSCQDSALTCHIHPNETGRQKN